MYALFFCSCGGGLYTSCELAVAAGFSPYTPATLGGGTYVLAGGAGGFMVPAISDIRLLLWKAVAVAEFA